MPFLFAVVRDVQANEIDPEDGELLVVEVDVAAERQSQVIQAVRTLVQAEPVMLPQGVRFECSREQKMAVLAVLAPLALQDIRLLEPSLEDMFFGFSG